MLVLISICIQLNNIFQETIAFFQELLEIEEPLLKEDWTQFNEKIFQLPFEGVLNSTHPNVISMQIHSVITNYVTHRAYSHWHFPGA